MSMVTDALNRGSTFLRNLSGSRSPGGKNSTSGAGNGVFKFPLDVEQYNRIIIVSKSRNSGIKPIMLHLPIPPSLPVADSHGFSSMNLGQIGSVGQSVLDNVSKAANEGKITQSVIDGIAGTAKGVAGQFSGLRNNTVKAAALAQIANKAGIVPSGIITAAAEAAMYNQRSVLNPNTVTNYTGSTVRGISLTFKLVASSEQESNDIRDMVYLLRQHSYPAGNNIVLEYPSEFTLKFLKANSSEINPYISPLYTCYLRDMSVAYNGSSNSFYENGAPLEVDITVGFQETKALTRDDLESMAEYDIRGD